MTKARVEDYNGSPAILIDGVPYPPMMATIRTNNRSGMVIDKEYFRNLGLAGIKIFFLICDTEWLKPGAFLQFREEAEALLEVVPDAYLVPRIGLHPPNAWIENNRDEIVAYSDGKCHEAHLYTESYESILPGMYSLCSQKWRKDAGEALSHTYDQIEGFPYADRIIGYFLAAGGTSEWYYINPIECLETGDYADFSPAFQKYFAQFLKTKYKTEENLKKHWKTPEASFLNPVIPPMEPRYFAMQLDADVANPPPMRSTSPAPLSPCNGTNIGSFLDVDQHQAVADFYRAWHLGTADSIVHFAKIIKEKSADKLVGSFYGSYGCTSFFHGGTAGGVLKILDSGVVDFLAAPGVYENRQPGGFTGQREMSDSFRLRNTMFIVEEDTRTHLENPHYQNLVEMFDIQDTLNVMKRDFGRNICEDMQAWWFDQHIGGGRYKHPDIYALISRQQEIARFSYDLDRRKESEIAFIYDEESLHIVSSQTTLDTVELMRNYEVARIGGPVDQYFHNDMENPKMPDYKLYVFFNTYSLSDAERKAIVTKLRKNGAVAFWLYAPGIINPDKDPKLSAEHISKLTGIRIRMLNEKWRSKFRINSVPHPITAELDTSTIYGSLIRRMPSSRDSSVRSDQTYLYPVLYADDPEATVLANFCSNKLPAVALKENDGWLSLHCGSKVIRADFLRSVAKFAGCHVFCESDDCIYANRNFITIHASETGAKSLCFPQPCNPYELYEKIYYGHNISSISFNMMKGETRMFSLQGSDYTALITNVFT